MSDVSDLMLRRFTVLYGEPKTPDLESFVGEYERSMRGFRRDIIALAADHLIDGHDRRSWPTPGECHKACDAAASEIERKRQMHEPPPLPDYPSGGNAPSDEAKARMRKLVAEFKASVETMTIGGPKKGQQSVDRDAWNARRFVSMSRHGDPIRKGD